VAGRTFSNAALAGICLLGTVALALSIWAVAQADDEPSSTVMAVAELEPTGADTGTARLEIVETADRIWMKLEVRGLPHVASLVVFESNDAGEPIRIAVQNDGDYTLHEHDFTLGTVVQFVQGDSALLEGRLKASD
jgi:hypothetical protein